jgi:putative Mn2+ efflux pump MntP
MSLITILLIGVGLACDAFAVAVACGLAARPLRAAYAFRIAFSFGAFQTLMPVIGWAAGTSLRPLIASFDHWIAFVLLFVIGGRMIYESLAKKNNDSCGKLLSTRGLLVLSVATSIDALAVGISFAFLKESIWFPSFVIGLVTFALCYAGVWLGNRFGHIFENKFEMAGGLILISIGIRILYSHLTA